jgi:hypothetical protein
MEKRKATSPPKRSPERAKNKKTKGDETEAETKSDEGGRMGSQLDEPAAEDNHSTSTISILSHVANTKEGKNEPPDEAENKIKAQDEATPSDKDDDENSLFGDGTIVPTTQTCLICLDPIIQGASIFTNPCVHIFCAECWKLWANQLEKVCRAVVRCARCREVVFGLRIFRRETFGEVEGGEDLWSTFIAGSGNA